MSCTLLEVSKPTYINHKNLREFGSLSLAEIKKSSLYASYLESLQYVEKVDLHEHLYGAFPLDKLADLPACSEQMYEELSHLIDRIQSGYDYSQAFDVFEKIKKIVTTVANLKAATIAFCQQQFENKVVKTELRTGLKPLDSTLEGYLLAVLEGIEAGQWEYPIEVTLVLSLRRDTPREEAEAVFELAKKHRHRGIVGFDVSGQVTNGDGSGIFDVLEQARKAGFPITHHIGELPEETEEQQMLELERLQPARLGHCVHLKPKAKEWVLKHQPVVEVCPVSALCVMLKTLNEHFGLELLKNSYKKIVFCADDTTIFGNLSEQLAIIGCVTGLSVSQLKAYQEKAREYAFEMA